MDDIPTISIVVPVYNVGRYLRKCVDSILAQTFTDFECIHIEDGSPDNCPAICDEYATKDTRVIVVHQKNAGVSAARNAGLDVAKGEWIGFVDSDDWCDPEMFEFLYRNAKEKQVDISMCGLRFVTDGNITTTVSRKCPNLLMDTDEALLRYFSNGYFGPFSVNKLVNRRLFYLQDKKLRYDQAIQYGEDRLLFYHLIKRSQKIFYSSSAYYNCYARCNSVTSIAALKGPTTESFTVFDAYAEMLKLETKKKIRNRIRAFEGNIASGFYFSYIKNNGYLYDKKSLLLKNIVKKNIVYIFFLGTFKEKFKICLVFVPFVYKLCYKLLSNKI